MLFVQEAVEDFFSEFSPMLMDNGRWKEVSWLCRRVLRGCIARLGRDHAETVVYYHNLAIIMEKLLRWPQAEKLHRKAADGSRKLWGDNHDNTFNNLINVSKALMEQKRWSEAEEILRDLWTKAKAGYGVCSEYSLAMFHNLPITLYEQERWSEGEELHKQLVQAQEVQLGLCHPHTLTSIQSLATALRRQGKQAEVEELTGRIATQIDKDLAEAEVFEKCGKWAKAEALFRQVFQAQKCWLKDSHPATVKSLFSLATVLQKQGRSRMEEAEQLYRMVVEANTHRQGANHPDTLESGTPEIWTSCF